MMGLKSSALLEASNADLVDVVAIDNGNAFLNEKKRRLNTRSPIGKIQMSKTRPPALDVT